MTITAATLYVCAATVQPSPIDPLGRLQPQAGRRGIRSHHDGYARVGPRRPRRYLLPGEGGPTSLKYPIWSYKVLAVPSQILPTLRKSRTTWFIDTVVFITPKIEVAEVFSFPTGARLRGRFNTRWAVGSYLFSRLHFVCEARSPSVLVPPCHSVSLEFVTNKSPNKSPISNAIRNSLEG